MTNVSSALPPLTVAPGFWEKLRSPAIKGALFKVCSCLCFSGINAVVRYFTITSQEAGLTPILAPELAFFESFFGLLFILPWILSMGTHSLKTNSPFYLNACRALAASMGIVLWFTALSKMPIVQVVGFKYAAAPFVTTLGAKLFLGEKCGWARALAIATTITGAFLIAGQQLFVDEKGWAEIGLFILLPIGATICYGTSAVLAKKQLKNDTPQTVCFYLLVLSSPILGVVSSFEWVTPLGWQWPYLILMGGFLAAAYIFLQHAYVIADITYLVPMSFTRLIAGAILGMMLFNEWPSFWTYIGSFFILLATVSLCKHEVRHMKTKQPLPLPAT